MILGPTKRDATQEDVENAPENMRAELIGTDLYLQPRPRGIHQHVVYGLCSRLPSRRRDGWVILPEVELRIPWTLVPDLSGWRADRFTEPLTNASFHVVPDWVCEVLSPSTQAYDRGVKLHVYGERGVRHAWLVDPVERVIESFAREGDVWRLQTTWTPQSHTGSPRLAPFGLYLNLTDLWDL